MYWASPILTVLLLVVVGLPSNICSAQAMRDLALARTLFEEGVALADQGDWEAAADRFGRAHAIKPTAGIAFNWASALTHVSALLEASELLHTVVRDEATTPALREESERMLDAIAPRLSQLQVNVADPSEATEIEIDGSPWPKPAWDVLSPVNPGRHEVICLREGEVIESRSISMRESESKTITLCGDEEVSPAGEASLESAPKAHAHTKPPYRRWAVWASVCAVVVAGAVTAGFVARRGGDSSPQAVQGNTTPGVIQW